MASIADVLLCAALALAVYACIGLPLAVRTAPPTLAPMLAPVMGWAVHSAVALPVFVVLGMSRLTVAAAFALPVAAAIAVSWRERPLVGGGAMRSAPVLAALVGAALLALAVMAAILPKVSAEGVALSAPIFDHAKIAIIDEIARAGVPPADPFFGGAGPPRLSYYYLWHFSAAEWSVLTHVSGWEADAALTWFTAFASLAMVIGLAVWLGGPPAALWTVALAAVASMRPVLDWLFGIAHVEAVAGEQSGFGGWLFQASWAPQHVASAAAAVLAVVLLVQLSRRQSVAGLLVLALTLAACFASSTWIGGIVLPLAAVIVATDALVTAEDKSIGRLFLCLAGAALLASLLISPFLYDQFRMTALRGGGLPIAVAPYPVLAGDGPLAAAANLPAFWLVFLPVEFPAIYVTGLVSAICLLRARARDDARKGLVAALAMLLVVSLCVAWMLASTLGDNNDLGWRAVLPAVLILMAFAAAGLSRAARNARVLVPALALILLGAPDGVMLMRGNIAGYITASAKAFAATPALWRAVRAHSSAADRIANNPAFMHEMTPWPVNISWALMANRRSCYASPALVGPLAALPQIRRGQIDALFTRVFAGEGSAEDVAQMATQFGCIVVVVTPADGAWERDPFDGNSFYRLADAGPSWRIYRTVKLARR